MATIGLLPASGKASRLAGIPKFCLPISASETLLHWHVSRMLEVCDEVRVCTRSVWAPLVEALELPVTLYVRHPSTMSDALAYMAGHGDDQFIVGMPDTIVLDTGENFYRQMKAAAEADTGVDVILAAFRCPPELRGQVGQLDLDARGRLKAAVDKDAACEWPFLWGGLLLRGSLLRAVDRGANTIGAEFQRWLDRGLHVSAVRCGGRYVDVGSPSALEALYRIP